MAYFQAKRQLKVSYNQFVRAQFGTRCMTVSKNLESDGQAQYPKRTLHTTDAASRSDTTF